jgi:hypothetical protein
VIGLSLRLALALGLHLRNEDPAAAESRKDTLVQTWWCLHSIECLVSTITGRPPVISYEDCTVPLPTGVPRKSESDRSSSNRPASKKNVLASQEASARASVRSSASQPGKNDPGMGLVFLSHINNTLISQKALLSLYSPRTAAKSWEVSVRSKLYPIINSLQTTNALRR